MSGAKICNLIPVALLLVADMSHLYLKKVHTHF
jgi:hypothetical protein